MTAASILCHGTQVVAIHVDQHIVCPLCGKTFPSRKTNARKEGR